MANTFKFGNGNWAVKDGYALAYNDENNNFKPLPFDFTRASSATRVNKQGLVETVPSGKPRIDFTDNTSGHLLLEPSRTNLFTYSENIPQNFATTSITDTFEYGTSPNGEQKSTRLQLTSVGTSRYADTLTVTSGTTYTFTCYYKGTSGETAYMYVFVSGGTSVEKEITFTGEWQREQVTFTAGSSSNLAYIVDSRRGGNASDFEVWGTQLEVGSYATSYIPTEGSSVTRVVELMTQTPPSGIIGQTEGTLYIDFTPNTDELTTQWLSFLGSGVNYVGIYILSNSKIRLEVAATTNQASFDTSFTITKGQRYKCAIAYANNDFTAYVNGTQLGTDTNGSVPATSTIRNYYNTSSIEGTNTNDLKLYDTRLTNTELQNLTS